MSDHGPRATFHSIAGRPSHNWLDWERVGSYGIDPRSPKEMYKEWLTADEIQEFVDDFMPYGEGYIHTLHHVEIITVAAHEELISPTPPVKEVENVE